VRLRSRTGAARPGSGCGAARDRRTRSRLAEAVGDEEREPIAASRGVALAKPGRLTKDAPRSGSPRPDGLSAPARASVPPADHSFSRAGADNEAARGCCSPSESDTFRGACPEPPDRERGRSSGTGPLRAA
jgi:hypothetical protein